MATNFTNSSISAISLHNQKYHLKGIPFHGTEAEWNEINYTPKAGEIIIYDADELNNNSRLKIGNGESLVKDLDFVNSDDGSDISVDTTLTQSGMAADSKTVGDWMNNIILSSNNYGSTAPEDGQEGQVFFVEDTEPTDSTLTISGAAADAEAVGAALETKQNLINIGSYNGDLNSFSLDNTICWIQSTTINNPTGTYGSCETWSAGNGGRVQRISCSAGVVQRIHTNSWGEWNWINQPELVWENASPSSEFAAQTVSLDLSDAGFVIIEFRTTSTGTARPTVVVANGKQGNLFWMANATANYEILVISRNATVSNTGITFEKGYRKNISSTTATENNASAIPTRIYAIKGAL